MASLVDRVKNMVSGGSERDACTCYDSSVHTSNKSFTLMNAVDKPVQMEEAAESQNSLSTRHVTGHYTDNAEPNADLDAEANVGLLAHSSSGVMEGEEEEKTGWRTPRENLCKCCGTK